MQRRTFIEFLGYGAAFSAIPFGCSYLSPVTIHPAWEKPTFLTLIWGLDEIHLAGKSYSITSNEKSQRELAKGFPESATTSEAIEELIKSDFTSGRTVVVNGWILSVTEARQCALAYLTTQK